jgi:hypothetical protein
VFWARWLRALASFVGSSPCGSPPAAARGTAQSAAASRAARRSSSRSSSELSPPPFAALPPPELRTLLPPAPLSRGGAPATSQLRGGGCWRGGLAGGGAAAALSASGPAPQRRRRLVGVQDEASSDVASCWSWPSLWARLRRPAGAPLGRAPPGPPPPALLRTISAPPSPACGAACAAAVTGPLHAGRATQQGEEERHPHITSQRAQHAAAAQGRSVPRRRGEAPAGGAAYRSYVPRHSARLVRGWLVRAGRGRGPQPRCPSAPGCPGGRPKRTAPAAQIRLATPWIIRSAGGKLARPGRSWLKRALWDWRNRTGLLAPSGAGQVPVRRRRTATVTGCAALLDLPLGGGGPLREARGNETGLGSRLWGTAMARQRATQCARPSRAFGCRPTALGAILQVEQQYQPAGCDLVVPGEEPQLVRGGGTSRPAKASICALHSPPQPARTVVRVRWTSCAGSGHGALAPTACVRQVSARGHALAVSGQTQGGGVGVPCAAAGHPAVSRSRWGHILPHFWRSQPIYTLEASGPPESKGTPSLQPSCASHGVLDTRPYRYAC